eukprot:4540407-Pyramimonas_sp.AAC.1
MRVLDNNRSRPLDSLCSPGFARCEVILRGAVGFLHSTRAVGGCRAGNDSSRFADIRRVRLSHSEV